MHPNWFYQGFCSPVIMKTILVILMFGIVSCSEENKSNVEVAETPMETIDDSVIEEDKIGIDSTIIIIDTSTNLMWMKEDFGFIEKRYLSECYEIFEWEKKINFLKYAGFEDWRIPTIKEYRSICRNSYDRKVYSENFIELDTTTIWGNRAYAFWSNSTPNKNTASYISFKDGFATSGNRGKQMGYMWETP